MKKKIVKSIGVLVFVALIIIAIFNIYNCIVCGKQFIRINTSNIAYANRDLYISIIAEKQGVDLETKTKLKLLNDKGKKVNNVGIKYEENSAILSIPQVEAGKYFIEAKVSSKAGKDKIQKEIYISNGNDENVTITLDKGIYKPGDTVNFRALITSKENDMPVSKDVNISIYDGNDNKVFNENTKSSDYGILSGNFSLANEVNSGLYKIIITTDKNETTKQFKVNPYITPKYEVKINYDKENYLVGDTTKINLEAKYFFGQAVQNADLTVYINNEKYQNIKSNSQGIAEIEYSIKEAKEYNIKIEAVDESNYFVEETSSFTAGTDLFEIKMLPEYGNLVSGKKNNVYIFTNKADGTPLKTYITVNSNNFTKQVTTDENGIGKFTIDIDEISNYTNNYYEKNNITNRAVLDTSINNNYKNNISQKRIQQFSVIAQDKDGNKVNKNLQLDVEKRNLLISTDKVKYNQGEDIKINISSITENTKNIYFLKGDRLVKMLSTDSSDTSVSLDDVYGLIDIYVTEKSGNSYYSNLSNVNSYKRTIFVKPSKKLNINISTNKEEFNPGEQISIEFNTKDENNSNIEAALLVSMLDNSILKLANNDLSIDNIKLALQNIEFSNELDAATLYSCITDDASEQTMMALLLKQKSKNPSISETRIQDQENLDKSIVISVISVSIIVITIIIALCVKFKKFRNAIKHIINFLMFDFIVCITTYCIIEEFLWRADFSWIGYVITSIVVLAAYISFVHKLNDKLFRTTISIIIATLLFILLSFLTDVLEVKPEIIGLIFALILLTFVIIAKISAKKELKIDKYIRIIAKEIAYIFKLIFAFLISLLIGAFIQSVVNIEGIIIPIVLVCLYFFNYHFNGIFKEKSENSVDTKRTTSFYIMIILSIIGIIAIVFELWQVLTSTSGTLDYALPSKTTTDEFTGGITTNGIKGATPDATKSTDRNSSNGGISSIIESAQDMITSTKEDTALLSEESTIKDNMILNNEENKNVTDDNIRNVFLESMCFIPELVTKDGMAKTDLRLSDNITTWTIQTIGNTKDGRIGYGMINNVKVFKEFFVDFELPKNLVETDNVSIPVTVYNYTDNVINTTLKIKEEEWFKLENNNINISIEPKNSKMVYIPINVFKSGNNKFRVEVLSENLKDIVEKECTVSIKGLKKEKVISTGTIEGHISEDILFLEDIIKDSSKAKVKIYSSTMAQAVEGMENIFKMPTGCFEQISSSLYPNILALKYLEDNKIIDEKIKDRALSYISSGYQKLLTYEVKGESGGYSLYGYSPAETVLTAYGLMELTDLSKVYSVDNKVLEKMTDFLYKKQNSNGTFNITGNHLGGASSSEKMALNAYITWALSESNPNDGRLKKSIEYLKDKLDKIDDNYTIALIANTLANVKDKDLNAILKRLVNNINTDGNSAYLTSNIVDYYGTRSNVQTIQTVALTSMALSKGSYNQDKNKLLINYLISKKDTRGTWHSTQATILALKALNEYNEKNKLENQTITVKVNQNEQIINIQDNPLELYELTFGNLNKENKLEINLEKGKAYYEVIEEYYIPYEKVEVKDDSIEVSVESNNNLKVNEILEANIKVVNKTKNSINNGMITISIPQGFTVIEESLMLLESKGIIEKYETSYSEVNIYLRNFEANQIANLDVGFRASYPVQITGLEVKAYDYYNPDVKGMTMPIEINVKQ